MTCTTWRAPKFLVRPKKGPTLLKSRSSWNLVPLPTLSIKRGRGACWGFGIRLGRGTSYSLIRTCIKPTNKLVSSHFGAPSVLGQAMGNSGLSWLPMAQTRGKPPPSPISYTLRHSTGATSKRLFVLRLPSGSPETVPKLSQFGLSWLWQLITPHSNLRSGWGLKQTCISPWELPNGVSHSACTHWGQVDSWLLVVRSETASLIPGPSFAHNLWCKFSNGPCEAIFDIYASTPFQRYKEHIKARCFDPCNRVLNFWESQRTPKSPFRECEWWPHTSLKVGLWHY
jgi:hypothetical protein